MINIYFPNKAAKERYNRLHDVCSPTWFAISKIEVIPIFIYVAMARTIWVGNENKSTVYEIVTIVASRQLPAESTSHWLKKKTYYNDVIMSAMASQITSLRIVHSTVYSRCRSGKHQSSASLAIVREIHWWPVNSPHKGPVTRKMFSFDDVIMCWWL